MSPANRFAVVVLLSALVSGCGYEPPEPKVVTGQVQLGVRPLAFAGVRFEDPRTGYCVVATSDNQGVFTTPSPLPMGTYEISITGPQASSDPNAPPPSPTPPAGVPSQYHQGLTSGLTLVLHDESETAIDLRLTDWELSRRAAGAAHARPTAIPAEG